jgi:hypothetical protein
VVDVLHVGALLSAGVGLPCTVSARRDDALRWIPAALMLLAMADLCFGSGLLAPIGWVAVMIAAAVWLAVRVRLARVHDGHRSHASAAWLHHACALMVMAGLTAVMGAPTSASGSEHHAGSGGLLTALAVVGSLAFIGYTAWLIARLRHRPQPTVLPSIEAGSMLAMVATMAIAAVL